jgi:hypothetical protein
LLHDVDQLDLVKYVPRALRSAGRRVLRDGESGGLAWSGWDIWGADLATLLWTDGWQHTEFLESLFAKQRLEIGIEGKECHRRGTVRNFDRPVGTPSGRCRAARGTGGSGSRDGKRRRRWWLLILEWRPRHR